MASPEPKAPADIELQEFLSRNVIFSILEENDVKRLMSAMTMVSYSMGENIVREGDTGDCAFLIFSGRVRVVHQGRDGKSVTLGTLKKGDLFGEYAILADDVRSATVRAADDVVLFRLDRQDFQSLLSENESLRDYFDRYMRERSIVNFLKLTTFLGTLPSKQIITLLDELKESSYKAGETIESENEIGQDLFIVKNGEVKVTANRNGRETLLSYLGEGDYFGERSLLLDEPRIATVTAVQDTDCFTLSRASFDELVDSAPKLRQQMVDQIEQYHISEEMEQKFSLKPPSRLERQQLDYDESPGSGQDSRSGKKQKLKKRPGIFKRFPWVRQHDETDCGVASLAMVSRYYGIRLSVGKLRDVIQVGREGASMYTLAAGAETLGYQSRAVKTDYASLLNLDLPAIAHWKGYHYIVLYRVEKKFVVVGDPAVGLIRMTREEFEVGWTGRLLLLTPTSALEDIEETESTFRRFIPLIKPFRFLLFEVFVASLILNLLGLATPIFTQTIVDSVLVHQDVPLLNIMLGGMLIVGLFQVGTSVLRQYLLIHVATKLHLRMSAELFSQIMKLTVQYFRTRKIGDIITRFGDNEKVQSLLTDATISTLLDVLMIIVYLSLMFYYSPQLTVVALIFVPLQIILTLVFTPILKRNNQKFFEKTAQTQSKLIESVESVDTIKVGTAELSTRWQYENLLVQNINTGFYGAKLGMAIASISRTLQIFSATVVLWYGAHLVIDGAMTVGQLMAFQALIGMTMAPIMGLVGMWQTVQDSLLSLQRLNDIYDADPEEPPGQQLIQLPRLNGEIKLENLSFRYNPDDNNILSNINLEIQPGQTLAIVGRSGSGKTTLISLLQRFYKPTEGRILVDGNDIASVSVRTLRQQMGVVLQENTIFTGTIRENIAVTDPDASLERIMAAAKLANAHDFIVSFPMGYDTMIGEIGLSLSGGQKQRVTIARALLNDPRILIFDEATSALDTESERAIQQNMDAVLQDRTAILIAHRLSTVQNADVIIVMDEGIIVEQGTHRELLDQKGLYYYLNSQQLTM